MSSYAELKAMRGNSLDAAVAALKKENQPFTQYADADERIWFPKQDDAGNGRALIRFLPQKNIKAQSWVRYWEYSFKGPTGLWYVEKSLSTIGKKDPVAEYNSEQWNTGDKELQKQVSGRKRNLRYIANILVLKEPSAPENEGKVFLFRFGKQIFSKIEGVMLPPENEEEGGEKLSELEEKVLFDPFNLWDGANFLLKVRRKKETAGAGKKAFPTYEDSAFEKQSALFGGDDDKLAALIEQTYDLNEFIDPSAFKSYDDLKAKRDKVLGLSGDRSNSVPRETVDRSETLEETFVDNDSSEEPEEIKRIFETLKQT